MSSPAIEVFRVLPHEADAFAQPLQGFLADTLYGLYVDELGADMHVLADPQDLSPGGAVARQADRIAASTDLSEADTAAYVLARDRRASAHAGIVGVGKFTRLAPGVVEFEEVDVALNRRGERIGPQIIECALQELAIESGDMLVLTALRQNVRAQRFWRQLGFLPTGQRTHHEDVFPDPEFYHLGFSAPQPIVQAKVQARLQS